MFNQHKTDKTPDTAHANRQAYRPDIDGLRAVAVLSVMAFHMTSKLPGGFVGVDVFFVISGYLIGSLLLGEMKAGGFSLAGFYERRIRRIFPALIVVMIATTAAAATMVHPAPFEEYAHSLLAATFSYSNVYFWQNSSYFHGLSENNPLLHTWSLGVEEQFYIAFPLFLMAAHRWFPRHLTLVTVLIAAVSLVWASIGVFTLPGATFYMPHTRAWELLAGVLVAMGLYPDLGRRWVREIAAASGAILVAGSILIINKQVPFPGIAALPPCLGAALIIAAGRSGETLTGRALALRPVVFVGLISYSLYLWHWPVIALLQDYLMVPELDRYGKVAAIVLSFGLAALTWWLVEQPIRRRTATRAHVFGFGLFAAGAMASAAMAIIVLNGLPTRFTPEVSKVASYLDYPYVGQFQQGRCFLGNKNSFADYDADYCLTQSRTARNVLLLGDSYSAHLRSGLAAEMRDTRLLQAGAVGCKPTLRPVRGQELAGCVALHRYIFKEYLPNHPVDLVVLSANWQSRDMARLAETLDWANANGVSVMVTGPIPEYDAPLPRLVALGLQHGDPGLVTRHRRPEGAANDRMVRDLARSKRVPYGSAYQAFCRAGDCATLTSAGVPVQFDHAHVTREGSLMIAHDLRLQGVLDSPVRD